MIDFYSKLLQFETERVEEYRAGEVEFPSIRLNRDFVIDLFPQKLEDQTSDAPQGDGRENLNHFCFVVDKKEWDELLEHLKTHDVMIEEGPDERWGARGTGRSFYFRDPEGKVLEARCYEDS